MVTMEKDPDMSSPSEEEVQEDSDDVEGEQESEEDQEGEEDEQNEEEEESEEDESEEEGEQEEEQDSEGELDVADDELSEEDEKDEVNTDKESGNEKSGWADAMLKVLNTGKASEKPIGLLSKAKLDKNDDTLEKEAAKKKLEPFAVRKAKKKEKDEIGRKRPDFVLDKAVEKRLTKLATKGVVQLFNAVREQQKQLHTELATAGKSLRKREKVFKNIDKDGFMNVLGGGRKRDLVSEVTSKEQKRFKMEMEIKNEEVKQEQDESSWKILRDDFMMNAKLKDWDKEGDSD